MKIYLVSQNIVSGYDTYDSFVAVAESEEDARSMHPSEFVTHIKDGKWMGTYTEGGEYEYYSLDWPQYDKVSEIQVKYIGEASNDMKIGVVCASFNAG